ncbi:tubulin-tyrosine ligase family protein [Stylonychia lemnae]|uniref:Tubulin-tyrosine ligase family protein n=1 Tax=Stylonychia lemnae TaxID=5949 RepID=A0A078A0P4_STYLE|nr:tubulin-tyrosine ligase family protein [Stylonychia lemnae]|eukprot:CDW74359.1 tubulin-tyrosine ligase family protein [Stylonychia lemnae]
MKKYSQQPILLLSNPNRQYNQPQLQTQVVTLSGYNSASQYQSQNLPTINQGRQVQGMINNQKLAQRAGVPLESKALANDQIEEIKQSVDQNLENLRNYQHLQIDNSIQRADEPLQRRESIQILPDDPLILPLSNKFLRSQLHKRSEVCQSDSFSATQTTYSHLRHMNKSQNQKTSINTDCKREKIRSSQQHYQHTTEALRTHEHAISEMKNYQLIMNKESHFKENVLLNPLIQYLIRNHFNNNNRGSVNGNLIQNHRDLQAIKKQQEVIDVQHLSITKSKLGSFKNLNGCVESGRQSIAAQSIEFREVQNQDYNSQSKRIKQFSSEKKELQSKRNLQQFMTGGESLNSSQCQSIKQDSQKNLIKIQDCIDFNAIHGDQVLTEGLANSQNKNSQSRKLYQQIYKEFQKNYQENLEKSTLRQKKLLEIQALQGMHSSRYEKSPDRKSFPPETCALETPDEKRSLISQKQFSASIGGKNTIQQKTKIKALKNLKEFNTIYTVQNLEINDLFKKINQIIQAISKIKDNFNNQSVKDLKQQSTFLGIKLTNQDLQPNYLKTKEFTIFMKSQILGFMNRQLYPDIKQAQLTQRKPKTYKFWVECSGNNHNLVKQIIKRRNWIILAADYSPDQQIYSNNNSEDDSPTREDNQKTQSIYPNLIWTQMRRPKLMKELRTDQIYNHLDGINTIATKSGLFYNLKKLCADNNLSLNDYIPETYLIRVENKDYDSRSRDLEAFRKVFNNHIWILKPGENSNRGHGIQVLDKLDKIVSAVETQYSGGHYKTVVLQKYIENPYLVSKRKFDLRVFCLLNYYQETQTLRAYYYDEGYLRTSCKEFSLKKIDSKYVHLTNDAVQKYSQDYGKFENGNKLSYEDFSKLLSKDKDVDFYGQIIPQIRNCMKLVVESAAKSLVGEIRYDYNGYEVLGFDFMLDDKMKLYLIECNTNPCLETQQSILLQRIIPQMLEQSMKIAVDPFLRATEQQYTQSGGEILMNELKYELIYEYHYKNKVQNK